MNLGALGKARTLEALVPRLTCGRVLPLAHFAVSEWRADRAGVLARIGLEFPLIVRSSAAGEDGAAASMAGKFLSVAHVVDAAALEIAIDRVIGSYEAAAAHPDSRVLVQPMLEAPLLSGVAFTRDPATGAPYRTLNYHVGADTAAVTAGGNAELRTFVQARGAGPLPGELAPLGALLDELEALLGSDALDVELALDAQGEAVLFQVRPLACPPATGAADPEINAALERVARKVAEGEKPHPFLFGPRTVFAVMPDWNPAEIIGVRPRPLALSLYRDLVTDSIWAYQRSNYGYRNLRSFPLMVSFEGLPYIDVRVSFNSFVPRDVEPRLAERLVSHYIGRLISAPVLHDKVEFDIVFSCYDFDLDRRLEALDERGFSKADRAGLTHALRALTNRILRPDGLWRQDEARLDELVRRHAALAASRVDPIARIHWLIEDCKRYGTLPFAGLARAGFVAVQILRSLVAAGALSEDDVARFMAGVDTVGTRIGRDLARLPRAEFLARYGHLRPGAYDILSKRYDEAPDLYFDFGRARAAPPPHAPSRFAPSPRQRAAIERLIRGHGLETDVDGLFAFLEGAVRGREHAKFLFTRNLSDALVEIGKLCAAHGLDADDASYVDAAAIRELHVGSADVGATLRDAAAQGRARHALAQKLFLPPLIYAANQVRAFHLPPTEPNFVGRERARGPVKPADAAEDLSGAIVVAANADPGFDWLFSRGIAGFVTAFGGANSHMAIRAVETGTPAAIGVGERAFASYARARVLELDCANRRILAIG
ncbi:MAG: PEP-utilizing enzyme [Tagaea sp.]|nr:PEP-utilizing enzyme [Tagaea sp.]